MKNRKPTIVLGADHAGFKVKEYLKRLLAEKGYQTEDVGTYDQESVDYPDFAERVGRKVSGKKTRQGVLSCGTGVGASIAANKVPGIRAALAYSPRVARLSREHDDANVLVLEGRPFRKERARKILNAWLKAAFSGGRHLRRVRKISAIEKKFSPGAARRNR